MGHRRGSHGNQPVVSFSLSVFVLFRLDHSYQPAPDDTPGKRRRIHEHEDVERISILAKRGRNEAEIERKHSAGRQYALSMKAANRGS